MVSLCDSSFVGVAEPYVALSDRFSIKIKLLTFHVLRYQIPEDDLIFWSHYLSTVITRSIIIVFNCIERTLIGPIR
jgi:hypothetical protein